MEYILYIWAKNARCEIFKWKIYGEKRKKYIEENEARFWKSGSV